MIFTRRFAVSFVVLLPLVVLSASVVFAADMFSGMWKVNIEKSTFTKWSRFYRDTIPLLVLCKKIKLFI